jgi:hypothetical protein
MVAVLGPNEALPYHIHTCTHTYMHTYICVWDVAHSHCSCYEAAWLNLVWFRGKLPSRIRHLVAHKFTTIYSFNPSLFPCLSFHPSDVCFFSPFFLHIIVSFIRLFSLFSCIFIYSCVSSFLYCCSFAFLSYICLCILYSIPPCYPARCNNCIN